MPASIADILGLGRGATALAEAAAPRRRRPTEPDDEDRVESDEELLAQVRAAAPEDVEDAPSWWEWPLELLDLPRNVVANVANLAIGAEPASKRRAFGLAKITGGDFMRKLGVRPSDLFGEGPLSTAADVVTGLAADVATDPLSWLGGAGVRAIGGVRLGKAGQAALAAKRTAALEQAGQRARQLAAATGVEGEALEQAARAGTDDLLERLGLRASRQSLRAARKEAQEQAAAATARAEKAGLTGEELAAAGKGWQARAEDYAERLARQPNAAAREFARSEGGRRLDELLARSVARTTPGAVDDTALRIGTAGIKHFNPLDLPAMLGLGVTSLVAPRAGAALSRGYEGVRAVTTPLLNPLSLLPEVTLANVSRQQLGEVGRFLRLPAIASAIGRIPGAGKVGEGLSELGRDLRRKFVNEPAPPRPGDAFDQERYEAERIARSVDATTARRQRGAVYDLPKEIEPLRAELMRDAGLDRQQAGTVLSDVAETLRAYQQGAIGGPELQGELRANLRSAGVRDPQRLQAIVEKLAPFRRTEAPTAEQAAAGLAAARKAAAPAWLGRQPELLEKWAAGDATNGETAEALLSKYTGGVEPRRVTDPQTQREYFEVPELGWTGARPSAGEALDDAYAAAIDELDQAARAAARDRKSVV